VRRVIDSNYQRAYKIIQTNMDKLQTMSEALIQVRDHRRRDDQGHHGRQGAATPRDWDDTPTATPRPPTAEKPAPPLVNPAGQHRNPVDPAPAEY